MADLKSVEIFGVGTWNGMKFVDSDIEEIIKNTERLIQDKVLKVHLKLGHTEKQILKQEDGQPSLGQALNFKNKNNKITSDFKNVPEILHKAIKKSLFGDISSELRHIKNFGWYISAVSILGVDLPAVKSLDDLQAFLSEKIENYQSSGDTVLRFSEATIINGDNNMPEKEDKTVDIQSQLEMERLKRELEELKTKNAMFAENERLSCFTAKKEEFLADYKKDVKEGKLQPSFLTKLESAIDNQKANFSENDEFSVPANLIKDLATAYSEKLDKKETAEDGKEEKKFSDVSEEVEIGILKLQASNSLSYSEASDLYFRTNLDMAKAYKDYQDEISFKEVR